MIDSLVSENVMLNLITSANLGMSYIPSSFTFLIQQLTEYTPITDFGMLLLTNCCERVFFVFQYSSNTLACRMVTPFQNDYIVLLVS